MRNVSRAMVAAFVAVLLCGCYEVEQCFTLNPDGSGKVDVSAQLAAFDLFSEANPDEQGAKKVGEILSLSKGVAVWRGVDFSVAADGAINFSGTAYFEDVSQLEIYDLQLFRVRWLPSGEGACRLIVAEQFEDEAGRAPPPEMSPEEMQEEIKRQRAAYLEAKVLKRALAGDARIALVFDLPGQVAALENMKGASDADATLSLDYAMLAGAMDELIKSDEWIAKQIRGGYDVSMHVPFEDAALRERLLGAPGPIGAMVQGAETPAFDYAGEVAAAEAEYEPMLEALGLKPWLPAPADKGIVSARLAGTRFVGPDDAAGGLRPFGAPPGCVIAVIAEFDGFFVEITGGELERAAADTGADLLPAQESERRMLFPYFADDKRTKTLIYFRLRRPAEPAAGISDLSGLIRYTRASSSREVDLGIEEVREGAAGKALDARVLSIGRSEKLGKGKLEAVTLAVSVPRREVSGLIVRDASGEAAWAAYATEAAADGGTVFHVAQELLPEDPHFTVQVWEDISAHESPFAIRNASWQCTALDDQAKEAPE